MLLAFLTLLSGAVDLGSVTGISDADARAALEEVQRAVDLAGGELRVRLQMTGGVTRILLVLEHLVDGEVDARAECLIGVQSIDAARPCIRQAIERFAARSKPLDLALAPATGVVEKKPAPIALYSMLGAAGALAVAGTVLAWYASSLRRELGQSLFPDERFLELEREERSFTIAASVVLGGAAAVFAVSMIWAALDS